MTPNTHAIIRQHVSLEVHCIDRVYLHACMSKFPSAATMSSQPQACRTIPLGEMDISRLPWLPTDDLGRESLAVIAGGAACHRPAPGTGLAATPSGIALHRTE